ncbi:interleukin-6 receptor subunit alpha [Erpetoichthys calabaricus]|uniref:interleukin-6 receptor subunit alpha n=1 Tax=Erpetoichthys calabaricus TaxID=27687 RepID=UPI0022347647|nr:interleukin-6 receptor subunit alpha [Erpetoichthys calabaricus]
MRAVVICYVFSTWTSVIEGFFENTCPQPVQFTNTQLVVPGTNMTLDCAPVSGDARGNLSTTKWKLNGRPMKSNVQRTVDGDRVNIFSTRLNDSGSYSCFRDGSLVFTQNISVGVIPSTVSMTCYQKVPNNNIRCEWISQNKITPLPKCWLSVKKGMIGNITRYNCSYSTAKQKCFCILPHIEGDHDFYMVSLCVSNSVGSTSDQFSFHADKIVKPDPPINVSVQGVNKNTRHLYIQWSKPTSWKTVFYQLIYEVRYKTKIQYSFIEHSHIKERSLMVRDALPGFTYMVQVRARDEFNGNWSEWSQEVYGTTWTDPKILVKTPLPSTEYKMDGSGMDEPSDNVQASVDTYATPSSSISLWIVAGSLLATLITFFLFLARFNKKLRAKLLKLIGSSASTLNPTIRVITVDKAEYREIAVESPPTSPVDTQPAEDAALKVEEALDSSITESPGPIHVMNMGYFLVPR